MGDRCEDVTTLLSLIADGDVVASERLMWHVYDELLVVAAGKLRGTPPGTTLTPTVLVHEAYGRVLARASILPTNCRHLFFAFARAMWQIVVEHRRRKRLPRSGQGLETIPGIDIGLADDLLDLDEAMTGLREASSRCYEVAILRKSIGLNLEETAELLETSPATVKRDWAFAKAWLSKHMTD